MKIEERMKLLQRFKRLRDLIHQKHFNDDSISESLYHFTNEKGLRGILESNKILFTRFQELNDEYEFSFLKTYIFELLRGMGNEKNKDLVDFFIRHFESYIKDTQLYTVSFCNDKTNNELWCRYAENNNGYALGFSENMFKFRRKTDFTIYPGWPIVFIKVRYGEDSAKNDLLEFTRIFLKLLEDNRYRDYKQYANMSFSFANGIFASMPRYKSCEWSVEKEYRFFMMDKGKGHAIPVKKGQRPYIEVIKKYLSEIVIGRDAKLKKKDIEEMLKRNKYDLSNINIIQN